MRFGSTAQEYTELLTPCNILPSFRYVYPYLKNKKILDVGSGTGEYLELFSHNSEGIDCSKKNLEVCRKKNLKVKLFDINGKLPYGEDRFEVIFCSHVLEHVESPINLLRECNRILVRKGILIVGLPTESTIVRRIYDHYFNSHPEHLYSFSIDGMNRLLEKTNFVVVDTKLDFALLHKFKLNLVEDFLQNFYKMLFGISNAYWIVARKK